MILQILEILITEKIPDWHSHNNPVEWINCAKVRIACECHNRFLKLIVWMTVAYIDYGDIPHTIEFGGMVDGSGEDKLINGPSICTCTTVRALPPPEAGCCRLCTTRQWNRDLDCRSINNTEQLVVLGAAAAPPPPSPHQPCIGSWLSHWQWMSGRSS